MPSIPAYHDSFAGVLPCMAIAMRGADDDPFRVEILVRYTAERPGYPRGCEEWWPSSCIIPRANFHRSRRGPSWYYTTPYVWTDLLNAEAHDHA